MEKVQFLDRISSVHKIKHILIVLVSSEYYFSFSTSKINMFHTDDNLTSAHRNSSASCNCWLVAESERRNQNTPSRKGLTCYDYCYYTAQSDTGSDNTDNKKSCRKAHVHPWHVEERREIMRYFFEQLDCEVYTAELCCKTGGSYILQDAAMLKQALLVQCRLVSASLFYSSMLSTMLRVVSTDIFPWSPVSIYKPQLRCQNIRVASAASSCKVSSWAIASSWALQYPMILSCLWLFSSTQSFFFFFFKSLSSELHWSFISQPLRRTLHPFTKCRRSVRCFHCWHILLTLLPFWPTRDSCTDTISIFQVSKKVLFARKPEKAVK